MRVEVEARKYNSTKMSLRDFYIGCMLILKAYTYSKWYDYVRIG
jgi:hypothetical protein